MTARRGSPVRRAKSPTRGSNPCWSSARCVAAKAPASSNIRYADWGCPPIKGGSIAGALHRSWLELRARSSDRDERGILEECERGEEFAEARYAQVLDDEGLPPELRGLIERQYRGVRLTRARVRSLRDQHSR